MMRTQLLTVLILMIFSGVRAGEYADAFILASQYPHVQALGNSTVATDISCGYALNNPAGIGGNGVPRMSLIYEQFTGLSSNYSFEGGYPIGEKYNLGLMVIHSSVADLYYRPDLSGLSPGARRDSVLFLSNTSSELIQYREDAVFLTFATELEYEFNLGWKFFKIPIRLPLGLSMKYLDKLLVENRGLGFGIDLGSQLFFDLGGMNDRLINTEFSFGLVINDILNTPVYWSTEHQDAIKRNVTIGYGVAQTLEKYSTKISVSVSRQNRYPDVAQYGFEVGVKNMLFLRLGHDGYTPSFGLGISLKKFIMGYTFSQHELSDMQKVGITYHF